MAAERYSMALAFALLAGAVAFCVYAFARPTKQRYEPRPETPQDYARMAYHPEVRTQCEALDKLGASRAPQAVAVFLDKLSSPDDGVAAASARWLGKYEEHSAIAPLAKQLETRSNMVKFAVVKALESIGDPAALAALKAQVKPESGVAADAGLAIGRLRDARTGRIPTEAEDALIGYLTSPNPKVRMGGILGLREGGTARSLDPLRRLAADPLAGIDPQILARPVDEGRLATPDILGKPCAEAIQAVQARIAKGGDRP